MQKFTYSLPLRFLYRYGNIPVTAVLLFYLFGAAANLDQSLVNIIPLTIALLLIYFLNRHFLMLYKILPFNIEADVEKIKCSKFALSKKEIIIYYKDIDKLTGGIFEDKINSLMKIHDGQKSLTIGFFATIKNSKTLQTIILSKVNKDLYDQIISRLKNGKEVQVKPPENIKEKKDNESAKNK